MAIFDKPLRPNGDFLRFIILLFNNIGRDVDLLPCLMPHTVQCKYNHTIKKLYHYTFFIKHRSSTSPANFNLLCGQHLLEEMV